MFIKLGDILSEKWYYEHRKNLSADSLRIVKTAANLLKKLIKNFENDTTTYPAIDEITAYVEFLNFYKCLSANLLNLR